MKLKTTTVSMPHEMHDRVKAKAEEEDRSVSSWLRIAAEEKLERKAEEKAD